ncbi:uncharacterized protein TNCT_367411 [Trichonephila clavata]|uniref:Pre-C2HC domain-containing protein n=1 Tax=Trichonephila clavata TaxID=2740835 RepID=A0A8X6G9S7_TRICU|nr:uncharacterized protein TNCT_367411 [Trichonephila clavata]
MEFQYDVQSVDMEDVDASTLTDEQICICDYDTKINIYDAREIYVGKMIRIEKEFNDESTETARKLEEEATSIAEKIASLESKMLELLPCPVPHCKRHNSKSDLNLKSKPSKKRSAEQIAGPSKTTTRVVNSPDNQLNDFKFPRKTARVATEPEENVKNIQTKNSFGVLNSDNVDVEDVTPAAPKIIVRSILMKLFPDYNLILQELHRTYPTVTNTHTAGYIKIQPDCKDQNQEITDYLVSKKVQHYVTDPPTNRPLKLVIKGLLASTDPEDIKKDLINQGIKIIKIAQLKKFKTKDPLPIFMIDVARDENVNDIFNVRSCLYIQIKIDPFNRSNRVTQCFNCNYFNLSLSLSLSCHPKLQDEHEMPKMW